MSRGGLRRRVAGAQLPGGAAGAKAEPPAGERPRQDAAALRTAMDDFQSGVERAGSTPPPTDPPGPAGFPAPVTAPTDGRGGLSRRVPGANLAPGLRNQRIPRANRAPELPSPTAAQAALARRARDPEAERAALDAFTTGLARARDNGAAPAHQPPVSPAHQPPPTTGSQS
jgi:hypothetical protein